MTPHSHTTLKSLEELRQTLVSRPREGHKGTFGTVLTVGGSLGMSGAAALCSLAALRSGAGLCKTAVPASILPVTASLGLEFTTIPLPETSGKIAHSAAELIQELAQTSSAAAIGPGMGRSEELNALVLELWEKLEVPAVFDADALNALAETAQKNEGRLPSHAGPRILTPHPGEFSRLCPSAPASMPDRQRELSVEFAKKNDAVVVLKGAGTQISDGVQTVRNTTGNPGMGTGGSGDVLTGISSALCAQLLRKGLSLFETTRLAVWIHGRAGDFAAAEVGECSLIASDLLKYLPKAIQTETRE